MSLRPSVTSLTYLCFEARGLKFCIQTLHKDAKRVRSAYFSHLTYKLREKSEVADTNRQGQTDNNFFPADPLTCV